MTIQITAYTCPLCGSAWTTRMTAANCCNTGMYQDATVYLCGCAFKDIVAGTHYTKADADNCPVCMEQSIPDTFDMKHYLTHAYKNKEDYMYGR